MSSHVLQMELLTTINSISRTN